MIGFKGRVVTLSSVIGFLAVIYVWSTFLAGDTSGQSLTHQPLLPSFQPSQAVEARLLVGGQTRALLQKRNDGWFVVVGKENLPASSARVETFLSSISDLRKNKLVSTAPALLSDFDLEGQKAGRVAITGADGKTIVDVLVGKQGASGYEDYVRLGGESRVFLTKSSLSFYLSRERSYWYRLFVFPDQVQGSTISAISVRGEVPLDTEGSRWSRESYRLVRGTGSSLGVWSVSGQEVRLSQNKVNVTVNNIASLQGVDFLVDPNQVRTTNRTIQVTVTTTDGKDWSLNARPLADGTRFLVRVSGLPYDYVVNTGALRRGVQPLRELVVSK